MFSEIPLCSSEGPTWLVFSSNVPSLIYYSHLPVIFISLLIGFFVYKNGKGNKASIALFYTTLFFSLWVILDSIFWASNRSDIIMFVWSVILIIEPLVYASSLYLVYTLIAKKDFSFRNKIILGILFLPLIILVPTQYGLSGFDIGSCLAMEGPIALYYTYFVEAICALWVIFFSIKSYRTADNSVEKKEIFFFSLGVIIFLVAFAWGNIIGSSTEDWNLAQYGLFGMPVFIGFLAYTIVKFKTFNIKLVGAQALIVSLVILIGSQFSFIQNDTNRILTAITLVITGVIGINLIRSVKKEIESREKIEIQEKELEVANARLKELDQLKSEFVSLATHQIRGPLTAIKGYASMMLEGDYGEVPKTLQEPIDTVYQSSQSLVVIVEDFLNVSRIEQGKMKYDFSTFDFCALVNEVVNEDKVIIERRGLNVSTTICPSSVMVRGDRGKLKQVVGNLLDNSMKYTPKGSVKLTLESDKTNKKVLLSIKDTGVGISAKTIPHLFQKFSRAEDASKVNILGTGLGLYVAKEMISAHGGKIWVESEGVGKGATFFVELALV